MMLCISKQECVLQVSEFCSSREMHIEFVALDDYPTFQYAVATNKTLVNYDYIFFYLSEPMEDLSDFLEAIRHIKRFYHARIIVASPACGETNRLFRELLDLQVRELFAVGGDADFAADLEECLSDNDKSFSEAMEHTVTANIEEVRTYIRPKIEIPEGLRLTIGVAGAQPRVGTTTQAFSIYHALAALGFTPCLIDSKQAFIEMLMMVYERETVEYGSVIHIRTMDFAADMQVGTAHNVFIFDLGELQADSKVTRRACIKAD